MIIQKITDTIPQWPLWQARIMALLAGAIVSLGFEPVGTIAGPVLGGALFLLLLHGRAASHAFGLGLLFGFGQLAIGLCWIATAFGYQSAMPAWTGWAAVLGLSLLLAIYSGLAAYLARRLTGQIVGLVLAFAALFTLGEILRGLLFTGFAWNPVGVAWLEVEGVARLGSLLGANGLTALAFLCAGSIAAYLAGGGHRGQVAMVLLLPMLIVLGLIAPLLGEDARKTDQVWLLVQPGTGIDEKHGEGGLESSLGKAIGQTRAALSQGPVPAAIVWPEAMVEFPMEELPELRSEIVHGLNPETILLTGGVAIEKAPNGAITAARNSLYALSASGDILKRYDKSHLVPGGEYLPLRNLAEPLGLSRLVPGSIDFLPGDGPQTWTLPNLPALAPNICYEVIFPAAVVDAVNRPAVIVTISNDAWFGPSGPPQHYAQARLRAIEEGLPVVRVTPTGISGVIGPRGEVLDTLPSGKAAHAFIFVPEALPATPFAKAGLWIPVIFSVILLGIAATTRRKG